MKKKKDIYFNPKKDYGSREGMLRAFNRELYNTLADFVYEQQQGWKDSALMEAIRISGLLSYARMINYIPEDSHGDMMNEMFNSLSELAHAAIKYNFRNFKCDILRKFVKKQLRDTYFIITNTNYLIYSGLDITDVIAGYFAFIKIWVQTKLGYYSWGEIKFGFPKLLRGYRALSRYTGLSHQKLIKAMNAQQKELIKNLNKNFVEKL